MGCFFDVDESIFRAILLHGILYSNDVYGEIPAFAGMTANHG